MASNQESEAIIFAQDEIERMFRRGTIEDIQSIVKGMDIQDTQNLEKGQLLRKIGETFDGYADPNISKLLMFENLEVPIAMRPRFEEIIAETKQMVAAGDVFIDDIQLGDAEVLRQIQQQQMDLIRMQNELKAEEARSKEDM